MFRALGTALLCGIAIVAGDVVFRTSLLRQVHPVVLVPADDDVVSPPVQVRWEGPEPMQVLLSAVGERPRDLGIHDSPVTLSGDQFPRDGGYQVELRSPRFGRWVQTTRWFQVHVVPPPKAAPAEVPAESPDGKDYLRALEAARTARDRAQERTRFLRDENRGLRDETARLSKQIEDLYRAQEDDAARQAELERRLTQLAEESHALAEENAAVRMRLGSVIPCTVWGYYNYPHPQTIPPTRRMLIVSNTRGQVFRAQAECEFIRRADPTAASICFCAGNSFGG